MQNFPKLSTMEPILKPGTFLTFHKINVFPIGQHRLGLSLDF